MDPRMMKYSTPVLLTLLLSGCAYQPTGVNEKPDGIAVNSPQQRRVASTLHWQLMAENEVKLLGQRVTGKPFFVAKNPTSIFSRTFQNLLTSGLVKNGGDVYLADAPGNVKITYEVQVVHQYGGKQTSGLHGDFPLPITGIAYYFLSEAAGLVKVTPAVLSGEMFKNLSSTTEIVLTTQATQNAKLLYSASNVYYIEDINQWDYLAPMPQPLPPPELSPADQMWNFRFKPTPHLF